MRAPQGPRFLAARIAQKEVLGMNAIGTNGLVTKSLCFPLVADEVAGFWLRGF
jgi:hypothetical protein